MNNIVSILVGNMDAIKALKSKYIMITPDKKIYGSDEEFVILRTCTFINGIDNVTEPFICTMEDLNYLYKNRFKIFYTIFILIMTIIIFIVYFSYIPETERERKIKDFFDTNRNI
jgi:hypothetical protein